MSPDIQMLPELQIPPEVQSIIDRAVIGYHGDARVLQSAIGALIVGLYIGRRPLLLIHGTSTLRKYQRILGADFHDLLPEEGVLCDRSLGYRISKRVGRFWDSVRGTAPGRSPELLPSQ